MSIRKRKWGTGVAWQVDYKDQNGKRKTKQFKTRKAAAAWEPRAKVQVQDGVHTSDSTSITIKEAGALWIERCTSDKLERATIQDYQRHLDLHINPRIGDTKLSKLTAPKVKEFQSALAKTHSKAMTKKVLTSLKAVISEAQGRGLVAQNVAREVKVRNAKRHKRRLEIGDGIPTKAEVKAILDAAQGRWRPLLVTAVFTGLRASELRGLPWSAVDFDNKVIRVKQRADRFNVIGVPKSDAGKRAVVMPPVVMNTLREWKLACPKGELGLVFPNGKGKVEALSNIYRRGFAPAQIAAGASDDSGDVDKNGKPTMKARYGLHALRHFYASWIIDEGFPAKKAQTMLGHESVTMTIDLYGHLFPSDDDDFEKLSVGELSILS